MSHSNSFSRRFPRRAVVVAALAALLGGLWAAWPAAAQDTDSARIASPRAGDFLFGLVTIQGTASNPNFSRYKLEFASQDQNTDQWFLIGAEVSQQVSNGVLAQWNTVSIPDGKYQLRLRVILRNGTVAQALVQNLTIANRQPTALPTALLPATPLPPTLLPTTGPSPTPLIRQPPTSTPRPTLVAPAIVPTAAPPPASDTPPILVGLEAIQNAFCSGVYIALAAFLVLGGYGLVHSRFRPRLRRMMRELRADGRE